MVILSNKRIEELESKIKDLETKNQKLSTSNKKLSEELKNINDNFASEFKVLKETIEEIKFNLETLSDNNVVKKSPQQILQEYFYGEE